MAWREMDHVDANRWVRSVWTMDSDVDDVTQARVLKFSLAGIVQAWE